MQTGFLTSLMASRGKDLRGEEAKGDAKDDLGDGHKHTISLIKINSPRMQAHARTITLIHSLTPMLSRVSYEEGKLE